MSSNMWLIEFQKGMSAQIKNETQHAEYMRHTIDGGCNSFPIHESASADKHKTGAAVGTEYRDRMPLLMVGLGLTCRDVSDSADASAGYPTCHRHQADDAGSERAQGSGPTTERESMG